MSESGSCLLRCVECISCTTLWQNRDLIINHNEQNRHSGVWKVIPGSDTYVTRCFISSSSISLFLSGSLWIKAWTAHTLTFWSSDSEKKPRYLGVMVETLESISGLTCFILCKFHNLLAAKMNSWWSLKVMRGSQRHLRKMKRKKKMIIVIYF